MYEGIAMTRQPQIDALRGLMLVLMCATHLPTRFAEWLGQPFGFVSAAEGFVFLSAYLVGVVYGGRALRFGRSEMRKALWRRAGVVYRSHVAMLAFLFTVIAWIGIRSERLAITNLVAFYIEQPWTALWTSLVLIYTPPLLDILPMYVLFMAVSPLILPLALRPRGRILLVASSALLWLAAQFGVNDVVYALVAKSIHHGVPLHQNGAFDLVAWQFVWVLGLCLGALQASASTAAARASASRIPASAAMTQGAVSAEPTNEASCAALPARFAARIGWTALAVALGGMLWRHAGGHVPFLGVPQLDFLFDKWHLGPLRMLNFFALVAVAMHFGPRFGALARVPLLTLLGRQSLPVFCAHLVVVLLALSVIGDKVGELSFWTELGVLAGTLAVVAAVAWVATENGRKSRAPQGVSVGVQMQPIGGEKLPAR